MTKIPFASPANVTDIKVISGVSLVMAVAQLFVLLFNAASTLQTITSMILFLAATGIGALGWTGVDCSATKFGDTARVQIQAHTYRVFTIAAFGGGFLAEPTDGSAIIYALRTGGAIFVILAVAIAFSVLRPSAVRLRLESEADRRIAANR